jgi:hypothetical protein
MQSLLLGGHDQPIRLEDLLLLHMAPLSYRASN